MRAAWALLANSFARGYSGASPALVMPPIAALGRHDAAFRLQDRIEAGQQVVGQGAERWRDAQPVPGLQRAVHRPEQSEADQDAADGVARTPGQDDRAAAGHHHAERCGR